MHRRTDRILTTHTGSLRRPPDLEELFRKKLAWAKLAALVEGAQVATRQLW